MLRLNKPQNIICPRISRIDTNLFCLNYNGDLFGRTNFHECTHIISVISATVQVAIVFNADIRVNS